MTVINSSSVDTPLTDWRRGWPLAIVCGVLQDPVRKLTPGNPVVLTFTIVAIYIIMLNVGDVFSGIGLNSFAGLIFVYLGGAMGVNAWLMKGFFDTIPAELDESARVDGATPAQVYWGVILPLAAPCSRSSRCSPSSARSTSS